MADMPPEYKGLLIGCPIPKDFFETTGTGESDHQIHAGSYHFAMQQARIERANLMAYSSILPKCAKRISIKEGVKQIEHGAEMKIIQAAAHVDKTAGETRATAGIMYGLLYRKGSKTHEGGLVCEYNGNETIQEAKENLAACLDGLYRSKNPDGESFSDDYELKDIRFLSATVEPKKRFGTALVALAFVNYIIPVLEQNVFHKHHEALLLAQTTLGRKGL